MKLVTNSFFYRKARKEKAKDAKNKYFDFNSLRSLCLSQKKLVPFLFPINIFILFLSLMGKVPKGIGVGKCRRQKGLGELKGAFAPLRLINHDFLRSYRLKVLHLKVLCLTVLCLSVFCLTVSFATAQTSIKYTYDDSGNRTHRTIVMKSPEQTPPPQDSTENIFDEEDPFTYAQEIENEDENRPKTNNNKKIPQEIYTDSLSDALITIYPNPTRGLLTVKFINKPQGAVSNVTLYDMQGKIVTQQQSLSDENRLDISAQPVGTYIMQIAVGEEVTSWKIIKSEL